jgi:hypothetical protein
VVNPSLSYSGINQGTILSCGIVQYIHLAKFVK